jgi:hypothetical protein
MPTNEKNAEKFVCLTCDFKCSKKSNLQTHYSTLKHSRLTKKMPNDNMQKLFYCNCGKTYIHNSSLCFHKKKCNIESNNFLTNNEKENIEDISFKTMFIQVVEQNKAILLENQEMRKLLKEALPKIGNTTNNVINNKFNLNFFLNEKCKDALNINDFIDSIRLKLTDLELVAKLGYIEGISKIFVKELKDLDIYKRPIHCSDIKRETLYIKDEDKWYKDNEEKYKIKQVIQHITHKNIKNISNWVEENPACKDSTNKKNDEYLKLISNSMSGENEEEQIQNVNKIISNVAKEVIIDK